MGRTIKELSRPVPCTTPLGDGYVWYITSNGFLENDEFTIILCETGVVRHFVSSDVRIWTNATYGINKQPSEFPF